MESISNLLIEYSYKLDIDMIPTTAPDGEYTTANLILFKEPKDAYDFAISLLAGSGYDSVDSYEWCMPNDLIINWYRGGEAFNMTISKIHKNHISRTIKLVEPNTHTTKLYLGYCAFIYSDYNSLVVKYDFNHTKITRRYNEPKIIVNDHDKYDDFYTIKDITIKQILEKFNNYDLIYLIRHMDGTIHGVDLISDILIKSAVKTI